MKDLLISILVLFGMYSCVMCTPTIVVPNNSAKVRISITNDSRDAVRVNGIYYQDSYDTSWTTARPDSATLLVWGERYHLHITVDGHPQIGSGWHEGGLDYTIHLPRK